MVKVPATFWNLLKKFGVKPEKMRWCYAFGYLAAKDLTEKEEELMRNMVEQIKDKTPPISGYICEFPEKGVYFIPIGSGMIMKIDCEIPKPSESIPEDSPYTLKFGYRSKE